MKRPFKSRPLQPQLETAIFRGSQEEYLQYLKELRGRITPNNTAWKKKIERIRAASVAEPTAFLRAADTNLPSLAAQNRYNALA